MDTSVGWYCIQFTDLKRVECLEYIMLHMCIWVVCIEANRGNICKHLHLPQFLDPSQPKRVVLVSIMHTHTIVLYMRAIYLCALCESLLDCIIKLHTNFNCAKLKFALSALAKQMTSNTVVVESCCVSCSCCWPASQITMAESARSFSFQ